MAQSFTAGEQGGQGEDEEVKIEVTQDEMFAMVQQFRKGRDKGKGKGKKGTCWNCGETITAAETARLTNRTTAGQMAGRGRHL